MNYMNEYSRTQNIYGKTFIIVFINRFLLFKEWFIIVFYAAIAVKKKFRIMGKCIIKLIICKYSLNLIQIIVM
jgi:hypothetical protein